MNTDDRISPDYPRDMVGYGAHPPDPRWPGGARLAVQFVINYEEGAENNILHGDAASESFLSEMVGTDAREGVRHMSMEWLYEYGSRAGFWRLYRLFTERGLPATVFAVGMALERNPEAARAMVAADFEIAAHGWRWIDYQYVDEATERDHVRLAVESIERMTGQRPVGWYTGRCGPNTRRLVAEHGGFLYDADSYADDLPYWERVDGAPQLIVPYTLDVNDMRFVAPQGFNSGDQFYAYLKDTFDTLYAEGETAPKMMSVGLHGRVAGHPGRAAALARFLDYVRSHAGVWIARRDQIARHWRAEHPYAG
ncbi:allantoinase PuuE [Salinisphaera orenii]|uniref:Chitin deacetylase n=1 Tax=Salinisphaera orenii YIM 95161 TaxID=1051139 RepID=A0A423PM80_9GAMM|nr:allantoinase PuuE [Salinisphaera halophila]ROO26734.1 chitin deacetylase [Salinisphaera halophila YIM 95161]